MNRSCTAVASPPDARSEASRAGNGQGERSGAGESQATLEPMRTNWNPHRFLIVSTSPASILGRTCGEKLEGDSVGEIGPRDKETEGEDPARAGAGAGCCHLPPPPARRRHEEPADLSQHGWATSTSTDGLSGNTTRPRSLLLSKPHADFSHGQAQPRGNSRRRSSSSAEFDQPHTSPVCFRCLECASSPFQPG